MLEEIKQGYYENAKLIDNFDNMDVNDLCFFYTKNRGSPNLDNYLSGIIYRSWGLMTNAYYKQGLKLASEDDCYNWLIDSILYVLEHCVWEDESHPLYKDEKAPEKAINVVFESRKINYFVSLTRQKRKLNTTAISLEAISENASDDYYIPTYDTYEETDDCVELIKKLYSNYRYFDAICIDIIINEDLVDNSTFDMLKYLKRLKLRLKSLGEDYAKFFSAYYGFDFKNVEKSVSYVSSLSTEESDLKLNVLLNMLKHDKEVKKIVGKNARLLCN